MYSKILKELRQAKTLREAYETLRCFKREYDLTFDQCRYLLDQYNN